MPFKVTFEIYEPGKVAPCFRSENRALARIELTSRQQKTGYEMTRMVTTVLPVCLTGPEKFLYLVYRTRKSQKRYWAQKGRVDKETEQGFLKESTGLERELDLKIADTRFYLQGHPKSKPDDDEAYAFFIVVEAWREKFKAYFKEKRAKGVKDPSVKDLRDECFDLEKKIDEYCIKHIGL